MEQKFYKRLSKSCAVTIPRAIRTELGIYAGDGIEIDVQDGGILISRHQPGCICCGSTAGVIRQGDKYVCEKCIRELAEKFNARIDDDEAGSTVGQTEWEG